MKITTPVVSIVLLLRSVSPVLVGHVFAEDTPPRPEHPPTVSPSMAFFGLFAGSAIRGKEEAFTRAYEKRLLYYEHAALEIEKAKKNQELNRTSKEGSVTGSN